MEQGRFEQPQLPGAEQDSESSDDLKTKKKKQRAGWLKAEAPKAEDKKEALAKEAETVWQRLIGEQSSADADATKASKESEEPAEPAVAESEPADPEAALEMLDPDEERYALDAYIEAREATLQSEAVEDEPPEEAAARAANLAFLAAVRRHLAAVGEEAAAIEPPIDQAYLETAAELGEEPPEEEAEDATAAFFAAQSAASTGGRGSSGVPPRSRNPSPVGPVGPGAGPLPTMNLYPAAPNAAPVPVPEAETVYIHKPSAGNLLVGGVIGYLIGRRRGRIKTEKRLGAVQKKLEQRVEAVQALVAEKETKIQQLAREKVVAPAVAANRAEAVPRVEHRPAEYASRQSSPAPERPAPARAEAPRPVTARSPERAAKKLELTKRELLDMSEKIVIGATNLRQVYETKLIGESGLRRLVYEHLEGGDIRRGLAREFLVKEMSFERDPRLRDSLVGLEGVRSRQSPAAPRQDVTPADATAPAEPASSPADPAEPPRHIAVQQKSSQQTVSAGLLIGLTLLTIGLAIYAVLLSLNR